MDGVLQSNNVFVVNNHQVFQPLDNIVVRRVKIESNPQYLRCDRRFKKKEGQFVYSSRRFAPGIRSPPLLSETRYGFEDNASIPVRILLSTRYISLFNLCMYLSCEYDPKITVKTVRDKIQRIRIKISTEGYERATLLMDNLNIYHNEVFNMQDQFALVKIGKFFHIDFNGW